MDETHETGKYPADKISLLGLLVLVVLIAYFLTLSRSAIVFSEPINCAGLSVSMPEGNGWKSEKEWKFQKNTFTLTSYLTPGYGGIPPSKAYCQYILAPVSATADERLKREADEFSGEIIKTDQIQAGLLTIDWAHIKRPKTPFTMFFGTAQLPNNRQLNIEVLELLGDTNLAEQVFKHIVASLKLKDPAAEIIAEIKSEGLR